MKLDLDKIRKVQSQLRDEEDIDLDDFELEEDEPPKPKKRKKADKPKRVQEVESEPEYPFYILVQRDKYGELYLICDSYYHFCWGTFSDKEKAMERLVNRWIKDFPTFSDISLALNELASRDTTGYVRSFIERFEDPEGYERRWRMSRERRLDDPPKSYDYIYQQIRENGQCADFASGKVYTILDASPIKRKLKQLKIQEAIKRVKEQRKQKVQAVVAQINKRKLEKRVKRQAKKAGREDLYRKHGKLAFLFIPKE